MKVYEGLESVGARIRRAVYGAPSEDLREQVDPNYRTPKWERQLMGIPGGRPTSDEIFHRAAAEDPKFLHRIEEFFMEAHKAREKSANTYTPLFPPKDDPIYC